MKFSENWLRQLVRTDLSGEALCDQLTMLGLEVESYTAQCSFDDTVVLAQIKEIQKHPEADKLNVCQVDNGQGVVQVVCGAPNVYVGMMVPMANVGTTMPSGMKIKAAALRGVDSNGMLCSAQELGLSEDHDGLYDLTALNLLVSTLGAPLLDALGLNDRVIEIAITPNRGDCISLKGIAIDLAAVLAVQPQWVETPVAAVESSMQRRSTIADSALCGRFSCRVIEGAALDAPTPNWISQRLAASGIRTINLAVDVTNYVMLETGQPMHAFDLEKISGDITVRNANGEESLALLDGRTVTPDLDTLLITDNNGPLALAGIMGGQKSGVTATSNTILLESAWFHPDAIQGRLRRYNCHTESGYRFERGCDPEGQIAALERATQLIQQIAGGKAGEINESTSENVIPKHADISLSHDRLGELLGYPVSSDKAIAYFLALGCEVGVQQGNFKIKPPLRRSDLQIAADMVEEVARLHGYENIPRDIPLMAQPIEAINEYQVADDQLKDRLVDRGFSEAISYSFIPEADNTIFTPDAQIIRLSNPISPEMAVMRSSLLPGLLAATQYNIARQQSRLRLFEFGLRFEGEQADAQIPTVAALITGRLLSENWQQNDEVDFYSLKSDLEALCGHVRGKLEFIAESRPGMHPGRCASIVFNRKPVGVVGQVHPSTAKHFGIDQAVYVFEIDADVLLRRLKRSVKPISKFPSVRRDLSLLLPEAVAITAVVNAVNKSKARFLEDVIVFDQYMGSNVPDGEKTVALGLVFQSLDSTLDDKIVDQSVENILDQLNKACEARLRH